MRIANVGHGANSAASTTTPYTSAVPVRRSRSRMSIAGTLAPETAFTFRVRAERVVEIADGEVGPQHRRRPHLGVGDLPEQEVRYPQLPAGADQEVRIGMVRRVEARRDGGLVYGIRSEAVADDAPHGVDDLGASAVIERERHHAARAPRGRVDRAGDRALQPWRQLVQAADDLETHVVAHQ